MINKIEYSKLTGNEFMLLQYLKVNSDVRQAKIAEDLGTTARSIRNTLKVLHGLYIIEIEKVMRKGSETNIYTVNEVEKWCIN